MLSRLGRFLEHDLWAVDLDSQRWIARVWIQFLRLLVAVVAEFRHRLFDTRAASLVYSTLLSLVPFLAVMFSVLKAFGVHQQIEPVLAQALQPLGEQGQVLTAQLIGFVNNIKVGVLGAVGLAALFFTTYSLIDNVEGALNAIWRVPHGRSWGRKFTDYLSVVLVGPVLIFTAFGLIAAAQSHWLVQRILEVQPLGYVVVWATQFMPFVLLCALFTFFYKFVPYTKVQLGAALVGGITAAILWDVAGAAFAAFVAGTTRYSAIYSSFAILILFLIWLDLSWLIVLIGGQVSFFYQNPSAFKSQVIWLQGSHAFRERLSLTLLLSITRRSLTGEPPYRLTELGSDLNVPLSILEELINEFVHSGILCRTREPEGVALARSPAIVQVGEVLDVVRSKDLVGGEPARDVADPVAHLLRRRDQAVELALGGITLEAFAKQAASQASAPEEAAPVLKEEVT